MAVAPDMSSRRRISHRRHLRTPLFVFKSPYRQKKQANNNDNGKTTATAAAAALLVEESDNLINAVALVTCRIISMRQKTRFWIHFYFASRRGKKWLHKDKIITVIIIFEFSFKKVFLNKNLLSSSPSFLLIPSQQPGYDICPISFYVLPFEHNEIAYKS